MNTVDTTVLAAVAAVILIFNVLYVRTIIFGVFKGIIAVFKWNSKRRKDKAAEKIKREKEETKLRDQNLKIREREARVQEREKRNQEPKLPKFYPAKFCKMLWQSLHPDDKEVLKDERIAAANFRLGVMSALSAVGVNNEEAKDVMERMEVGKF